MLSKLFFPFAISVLVFVGSTGFAASSFTDEPANQTVASESQFVSLCSSWSYESSVQGYICRFHGPSVRIPEERDVQRLKTAIQDLEAKLQLLEARVRQLEDQR